MRGLPGSRRQSAVFNSPSIRSIVCLTVFRVQNRSASSTVHCVHFNSIQFKPISPHYRHHQSFCIRFARAVCSSPPVQSGDVVKEKRKGKEYYYRQQQFQTAILLEKQVHSVKRGAVRDRDNQTEPATLSHIFTHSVIQSVSL